jgi:hypothetical protein
MNEFEDKLSCAAFQNQWPDLIEGGGDLSTHAHLQTCELCRSLMADLETIAAAARQLFPIEEPPDELWEQIESRIKSERKAPDETALDGALPGNTAPERA